MNKEDLKLALTQRGIIAFDSEATNKELTALLKAATDAEQSDGATPPDADEIKPSVIDEKAAQEIADAKPAEAPKGISEEAIKEKLRFGLSRKQAIEILQSQAAHDAELAKAEKNKGKA